MGKNDRFSHALHIPKSIKFNQKKPSALTNKNPSAPQAPHQGTSAQNMFKY
ncbi:MAG: hypothetical protein NVSMB46_06540 [Candidatus Saccharimonadales bacterium]